MLDRWPNPCASPHSPVAIIDIGVAEGSEIPIWLEIFGRRAGCKNTTLFLFEENPIEKLKAIMRGINQDEVVLNVLTVQQDWYGKFQGECNETTIWRNEE